MQDGWTPHMNAAELLYFEVGGVSSDQVSFSRPMLKAVVCWPGVCQRDELRFG